MMLSPPTKRSAHERPKRVLKSEFVAMICSVIQWIDGALPHTSTIALVTNRNLRKACPSGVSTNLYACHEISCISSRN